MPVEYSSRISRLAVDKLGVKLYDRVSAVIAELIANAYDADATRVSVSAPMGQYLATRTKGDVRDNGLEIQVSDDGCGMTPREVQDFFLVVGDERRKDSRRGDKSRKFYRKVMGRKGIGKLAPFGICRTVELISAGGELTHSDSGQSPSCGYLTSHVILRYDDIVAVGSEPDDRYRSERGDKDETLSESSGTRIILRDFNLRRVPDIDTLSRELAQRFDIESRNWLIRLVDNGNGGSSPETVGRFEIDTIPNTRITFLRDRTVLGPDGTPDENLCAGFEHGGSYFPVDGWMAYSKTPHCDDLMAGVRIYCRGKIAAQTSVFNRPAGFSGEHNVRSYLVGALNADWLDEAEDRIQTDRRDILWSDDVAAAFENWGQDVVERIGLLSRDPIRKATLEMFLETGNVEARIRNAYPSGLHETIRDRAIKVAQAFGSAISRREAEDAAVVGELVDQSIDLAPHIARYSVTKEAVTDSDRPVSVLATYLRIARLAELSSFGRVAEDRLKVVKRLQELLDAEDTRESDLQQLIADAPWLVNPEWAPVTENQTFVSFRREFELFYERQTGRPISLGSFRQTGKRPDFLLASQERTAQIIEIKKPRKVLTDEELDRIGSYHDVMEAFLGDAGSWFLTHFNGFQMTLVCDELALSGFRRAAFRGYCETGRLTHLNWATFLLRTERVHQVFLDEAERQRNSNVSESVDDEKI